MAVLTEQVITNTELYVPESNILSDEQMTQVAMQLITEIGDADENLPQISCEFLKRLADINDTLFSIDDASIKSEKLGRRTLTWDSSLVANSWKDYKSKVSNVICPILGVPAPEVKKRVSGAYISSGEKICVNGEIYP